MGTVSPTGPVASPVGGGAGGRGEGGAAAIFCVPNGVGVATRCVANGEAAIGGGGADGAGIGGGGEASDGDGGADGGGATGAGARAGVAAGAGATASPSAWRNSAIDCGRSSGRTARP